MCKDDLREETVGICVAVVASKKWFAPVSCVTYALAASKAEDDLPSSWPLAGKCGFSLAGSRMLGDSFGLRR